MYISGALRQEAVIRGSCCGWEDPKMQLQLVFYSHSKT
jgi:hypothetical protein